MGEGEQHSAQVGGARGGMEWGGFGEGVFG